jgi:biotin carboxyl carrier protein
MNVTIDVGGVAITVELVTNGDTITARVGDREYRGALRRGGDDWKLDLGERVVSATVVRDRNVAWIAVGGEIHRCTRLDEDRAAAAGSGVRSPHVVAPMPGKVLDVRVRDGDRVGPGDVLAVLEAMKMETPATAEAAGTVTKVHVSAGSTVEPGQVLVDLAYD